MNVVVWLVVLVLVVFAAVRSNPELLRGVLRDALQKRLQQLEKESENNQLLEELLSKERWKDANSNS